jgi:DNA-binding beta-propeller fold protein YncE
MLLPNHWSLRPAGRQIPLRDFPVNIAVHPRGQYAAVLHSGYSQNVVTIIDLSSEKLVSHANIRQGFYGLEFSGDGRRLYCSGAGEEVIHSWAFQGGNLADHQEIHVRKVEERGIPAGLALDSSGSTLFVANLWGDRISRIDLVGSQVLDIPLRTNAGPLLKPQAPFPNEDVAAAEKRADRYLLAAGNGDTFPYGCRLDEKRQRLYVSLWAHAAVAVIDLTSNEVVARWPTEDHPCEMILSKSGKTLFVANANRNTVTVLDAESGKPLETIWAALHPDAPTGSTPNSLALSPDEKTLFVANADNNVIAVFDVSRPGRSRSLGFIPVGWYPTSVRVAPDGKHLMVANGKGGGSRANPLGPQPGVRSQTNSVVQLIARLFPGSLSVIDIPSRSKFERELKSLTAQAYRCTPQNTGQSATTHSTDNPVPQRVGAPSPIKYVFYLIKENRTYDQVFGDVARGKGDPSLCLFPEHITPNHHKLASNFVLLDNFYADAEVSADGHEWSMGAYATDFVEKSWPLMYGHNNPRKYPYPAEGNFDIATPAGGYLWDRAKEAGVSYRSYGEFVTLFTPVGEPATTSVKSLRGHVDPGFRGFDLDYLDAQRADRFISELHRFEREGGMPRLQIIRLPSDHTHGTSRGKLTPRAYMADNDLAFGRVVEAISRSSFWPQSAIFVVEDDAQNGPDHIDAHRTIAFVISPYARRNAVDSAMYSTSSMLRTMELILGLKPMSQFDAAATPMFNSFQAKADLTPYTALPANVNLAEKNDAHAWGGDFIMNFAKEDAADDLLLNEVIWRSVHGADSPMPAPTRAGFVFQVESRDAD